MSKLFQTFIGAATLGHAACTASTNEQSDDDVVETLFGQEAPGMTPAPFAPGLVTKEGFQGLPAFSPDMKEFYFIRQAEGEAPGYAVLTYHEGAPQLTSVETTSRLGEVFISTDGNTMHLGNEVRKRTEDGWSDLESLGDMFAGYDIMRLTASQNGTYVFDVQEEIGAIRFSQIVNGVRQEPQAYGEQINSGRWTAHPFIAPDESYIIWDSERDDGFGAEDLYVSFRQDDGTMGPAINLGDGINSELGEAFGLVSPDGKYFFFVRNNLGVEGDEENFSTIFWVDAAVIENLRPAQ